MNPCPVCKSPDFRWMDKYETYEICNTCGVVLAVNRKLWFKGMLHNEDHVRVPSKLPEPPPIPIRDDRIGPFTLGGEPRTDGPDSAGTTIWMGKSDQERILEIGLRLGRLEGTLYWLLHWDDGEVDLECWDECLALWIEYYQMIDEKQNFTVTFTSN